MHYHIDPWKINFKKKHNQKQTHILKACQQQIMFCETALCNWQRDQTTRPWQRSSGVDLPGSGGDRIQGGCSPPESLIRLAQCRKSTGPVTEEQKCNCTAPPAKPHCIPKGILSKMGLRIPAQHWAAMTSSRWCQYDHPWRAGAPQPSQPLPYSWVRPGISAFGSSEHVRSHGFARSGVWLPTPASSSHQLPFPCHVSWCFILGGTSCSQDQTS